MNTIYDYIITLCGDPSAIPHGDTLAYAGSVALLLFIYWFIYWILKQFFTKMR